MVTALATWGIAPTGPLLADTSVQARAGKGCARADLAVDYDARTITCPQASWTPCAQRGENAIVVHFSAADCGSCPARALCTCGKHRQLTLPPRHLAEAQAAACGAEKMVPFQADYARRDGVGAPCTKPSVTALTALVTAACPKPASTTSTWPGRSTSSGSAPTGPAPAGAAANQPLARFELSLAA